MYHPKTSQPSLSLDQRWRAGTGRHASPTADLANVAGAMVSGGPPIGGDYHGVERAVAFGKTICFHPRRLVPVGGSRFRGRGSRPPRLWREDADALLLPHR